jgi:hypothetical protein
VTDDALHRHDKLLGMIRRCDRLAALCPDPSTRSPELIRAVAELRVELAADDRYSGLDRPLAAGTVEGVQIALASARATIGAAQKRLLAGGRAA